MRAVTVTGGELGWGEAPDPVVGPGEVLIDIAAAGVNRADLMQARGLYPPPPGASEILGLECAGTVTAVGPRYDDPLGDARSFAIGDRVCALLSGGGYAERVAVPSGQVLPIPEGLSFTEAAALPEAVCTVWSNLVMTARLTAGETVLIHGGSSGIGTMGIQLAALVGARSIVTASTDGKLAACTALGAGGVINYSREDFVTRARELTGGRGADVILDLVGADYLARNIAALADGGRLVIIGLMGGARAELDLGALMDKRAAVIGTKLRSRAARGPGSKAEIVASVRDAAWPSVASGAVRPVVGLTVPMDQAGRAHAALRSGEVIGKAVLVRDIEFPDGAPAA